MSSLPNTNQIDVIKNFITNNDGIQRANRYEMSFSLPNLATVFGDYPTNTDITLYPAAVSFGARAINYVYDNLQGYGYGRAVPNSSKYVGGIVLTFLVTGNLKVMNMFYDWMDLFYQKQNQSKYLTTVYYENTVQYSTATLKFLNLNGVASANKSIWQFKEVYPVECMPIELSAKTDTPLLFQVVLNYKTITRSTAQ